jgi:hypothetical protein
MYSQFCEGKNRKIPLQKSKEFQSQKKQKMSIKNY